MAAHAAADLLVTAFCLICLLGASEGSAPVFGVILSAAVIAGVVCFAFADVRRARADTAYERWRLSHRCLCGYTVSRILERCPECGTEGPTL